MGRLKLHAGHTSFLLCECSGPEIAPGPCDLLTALKPQDTLQEVQPRPAKDLNGSKGSMVVMIKAVRTELCRHLHLQINRRKWAPLQDQDPACSIKDIIKASSPRPRPNPHIIKAKAQACSIATTKTQCAATTKTQLAACRQQGKADPAGSSTGVRKEIKKPGKDPACSSTGVRRKGNPNSKYAVYGSQLQPCPHCTMPTVKGNLCASKHYKVCPRFPRPPSDC